MHIWHHFQQNPAEPVYNLSTYNIILNHLKINQNVKSNLIYITNFTLGAMLSLNYRPMTMKMMQNKHRNIQN